MTIQSDVLYSSLQEDLREQGFGPVLSNTVLGPWLSKSQAAAVSLSRSLLSKFQPNDCTLVQKDKALDKFLHSNALCKEWTLNLNTSYDEVLWGEFKRALYNFWMVNEPSPDSDYTRCYPLISDDWLPLSKGRCGPGASLGSNGFSFYEKLFSSRLTVSDPGLYSMYKHYIKSYPEWLAGEETRSASFGAYDVSRSSSLSYVPKNTTIARTICTEPSLNMFYQLGVGEVLSARLSNAYGINIPKQQAKNRELARRGSAHNWFATIDLSSASDSVGLPFLRSCMPRDFLERLCRYRCEATRVPGLGDISLEMISSMGNGYTFALETVIFTCIVDACYTVLGLPLDRPFGDHWGNFAVYGDDIIVLTEAAGAVLKLLNICGFRLNQDKTFVDGPFKESCGADFFKGVDIRGVYIKALATKQDLCIAVNGLNAWSARTGIRLPRVIGRLLSAMKGVPLVPFWENDDAGLKVPGSMAVPRRGFLGSYLYSAYRARPHLVRVDPASWEDAHRRVICNPSGLLIAFLQGSIRSDKISIRHDRCHYDRIRCTALSWDTQSSDWLPGEKPSANWHPLNGVLWGRWNSAVYENCFGK